MKVLRITDAHSINKPKQEIVIELSGGSPWYGYIWLNDEIFTVYLNGETGKVTIEPID